MGVGGDTAVVPEPVIDAVKRSLVNVDELRIHLLDFLALSEPEVLAELPPLLRLRCHGVHPDDHPVKAELERLSLYQEKLDHSMALSKAPLRPSTTLNYQAATRFIEHSLSDLTTEQRQSMKEISRGEAVKNRSIQKKRKYQSSEKQSVRSAAQEFLEKAKQELFGASSGDMKGPLRFDNSDDEDTLMD
ncbi:Exosome-associated factor Rrp47/DNA strand repair C1D [Macleaya cordata]|uniref:Nuclear nucleic acid-binding protein C1D n=1 Tax=Macleaya cordata TaxID=56857 RepID=A0A200QTU6_MACCD|nr:Exosome-associated factor Rrp47/DNA strand repair C1D [Macleaya cordata]